jgi:hypothetical protein
VAGSADIRNEPERAQAPNGGLDADGGIGTLNAQVMIVATPSGRLVLSGMRAQRDGVAARPPGARRDG